MTRLLGGGGTGQREEAREGLRQKQIDDRDRDARPHTTYQGPVRKLSEKWLRRLWAWRQQSRTRHARNTTVLVDARVERQLEPKVEPLARVDAARVRAEANRRRPHAHLWRLDLRRGDRPVLLGREV